MADNKIGREGAIALAGAVQAGALPALTVLNLGATKEDSVNRIEADGATALAAAAQAGALRQLTSLNLKCTFSVGAACSTSVSLLSRRCGHVRHIPGTDMEA